MDSCFWPNAQSLLFLFLERKIVKLRFTYELRDPYVQKKNCQYEQIIIIIMVLFYLFIQYYAVLKEISIR